jgi:NTE family protein
MPQRQMQNWFGKAVVAALLAINLSPCCSALAQSEPQPLSSQADGSQMCPLFTAKPEPDKTAIATFTHRPTVALALGGGGAKAAAHIGVLRVFQQEGIPIDYIAGTSIGSTIGGMYCAGLRVDRIDNLMVSGKLRRVIMPSLATVIGAQVVHHLEFWRHSYGGLLTQRRFKHFISKYCGDKEQFEDLNVPFTAVAANLLDGKECDITSGDLAQGMAASYALSPFYKPVAIDDKLLVDGGILANLPVRAARNMGADIVIAVNVDTTLHPVKPNEMCALRRVAGRVADIFMWSKDSTSATEANLTIYPDVDAVRVIEKHPAKIRLSVEQGEIAARKALPEIRELLETVPHMEPQRTAEANQIGGS